MLLQWWMMKSVIYIQRLTWRAITFVSVLSWCRSGMPETKTPSNGLWSTLMSSSTWWEESGRRGIDWKNVSKNQICHVYHVHMKLILTLRWLKDGIDIEGGMVSIRMHVSSFCVKGTITSRMSSCPSLSRLPRQPERPVSQSLSTCLTSMLTYAAHPNTWGTR